MVSRSSSLASVFESSGGRWIAEGKALASTISDTSASTSALSTCFSLSALMIQASFTAGMKAVEGN